MLKIRLLIKLWRKTLFIRSPLPRIPFEGLPAPGYGHVLYILDNDKRADDYTPDRIGNVTKIMNRSLPPPPIKEPHQNIYIFFLGGGTIFCAGDTKQNLNNTADLFSFKITPFFKRRQCNMICLQKISFSRKKGDLFQFIYFYRNKVKQLFKNCVNHSF